VTGARIGRTDGADIGPALGAARMALVARGDGGMADVMTKPRVRHWFAPRTHVLPAARSRLAAYRALYPALKSVQAQMQEP
jgi:xylulokinase